MEWRIAIDTHDPAAYQHAPDGEHAGSDAPRLEVSRRTVGKIIGVATVGAATAGALGDVLSALPAAAAESKSSSSTTHRLFPHTNGPRTPASRTGPFLSGVQFEVTTGGCWLEGFWWWVCHRHQSTKRQKFALWQVYTDVGKGKLIKSATVESGRLRAGRWNYVALKKPVPLAIGASYVAATGFEGNFPATNHQFGAGERYAHGIKSGPLFAYSDLGGKAASPVQLPQALFSQSGSNPTTEMPDGTSNSANFWMDLQVTTRAPKGVSYRLWPNYPVIPPTTNEDNTEQTFGTEFKLSKSCNLDKIWFYSPPLVSPAVLPTICGVWEVSTQSVVAGTENDAPNWSGAAGSGWVSCSYTGVTLPVGDYKVAVYTAGGATNFYQETESYFGASGPGGNGIVFGPLTAPSTTTATSPGQTTYAPGGWLYPDTYDATEDGQNRWVDVEVMPV